MMTSSGGDQHPGGVALVGRRARRRRRGAAAAAGAAAAGAAAGSGGRGGGAARRLRPRAPRGVCAKPALPASQHAQAEGEGDEQFFHFDCLFRACEVRGRPCRFRRCGCARPAPGRRRRSCRRRSCRCARRPSTASITRSTSVVGDGRLDLHLGQEVDDVLGAAVQLGVALLAAEALDLGHRDALHADGRERLAHFVELERFDDGCDQLHGCFSFEMEGGSACAPPTARLQRLGQRHDEAGLVRVRVLPSAPVTSNELPLVGALHRAAQRQAAAEVVGGAHVVVHVVLVAQAAGCRWS